MDNVEHQGMLRATTPPDFLDSSVEWRRIFLEIWGTFLLVVVAAQSAAQSPWAWPWRRPA